MRNSDGVPIRFDDEGNELPPTRFLPFAFPTIAAMVNGIMEGRDE